MENGGNKKVNMIFEARLNVAKPSNSASGPVRERFIRDKYERRKFYDPSAFELVADMDNQSNNDNGSHNNSTMGEQEKVIVGVQRRLAADRGNGGGSTATTIRKPSDAARKRVEERAARNRAAVGANTVRSKPINNHSPVAAPASAPVADLHGIGDFDSPEATSVVAAATLSSPVMANSASNLVDGASDNEPKLDLFANMSITKLDWGTMGQAPQMQQMNIGVRGQQQQAQESQKKKMTSDEIMAMFHTPNPQSNTMQQSRFSLGGCGMPTGVGGGVGIGGCSHVGMWMREYMLSM